MARGPAQGRDRQRRHRRAQSCNVGQQQTVSETRKLFREHLMQLPHSAADQIDDDDE